MPLPTFIEYVKPRNVLILAKNLNIVYNLYHHMYRPVRA